ncbi:hypothetical protein SAMN06297280_3444 [Arsukibacterium tuosuense]|uniref:Uncharacterized protein n=1 Tax=Arsukibacterium tuosuense TaxID=1323745 RepID=A0A285JHJ7_9GAMM|nr:hypothetical protein [Arsukibacterium tuosuense]SNY58601.1 hypothetical protein SAMN06297280_3444 [Arsukibacterium tuosuense]
MELEIGERATLIIASGLVITFKLVVLLLAYKTIKLGYDLLLRGVKGEFQFSSDIGGHKADLRSASPGLLFVLLGCAVMYVSIIEKYPQEVLKTTEQRNVEATNIEKPPLKNSDWSLE